MNKPYKNYSTIDYICSYDDLEWDCSISNIVKDNHIIHCCVQGNGIQIDIAIHIEPNDTWFVVPLLDIGGGLAKLEDIFWNHDKLTRLMGNEIDAYTVAKGLRILSETIKKK